ncbi:VWA domain-containing protein [Granulicella paludicola]|uniref:VWA domain-containing protein n=1 Tax=Granulicella paludicola TaxID=474951 RepID=UPI0021DF7D6D|nr:VWA domain-containing protein [Granulicella paludicola]
MKLCVRWTAWLGCGVVMAAGLSLRAQTATITVNTRLVVLDVSATDKDGQPIAGLTRDDFQIFEDDKLQPMKSFEAPAAHVLPQDATGVDEVFDPAEPKSFGQSPVTVLVLDQLNTHFEDSSFARRQLHDYLATQPAMLAQPTTLLTLEQGNFRPLQGFTRSRDALLKALAGAPTKYAWALEVNGKADHGPLERLEASLNALEEMAQSYARVPGKKNLVWVGGGFPSLDPDAVDAGDLQLVKNTIQHVTDVLLEKRMTVYAVDPTSSMPGMTEVVNATQMMFVQTAGDAATGDVDPFGARADFDKLGPVTGGRIVRGRNDLGMQIGAAIAQGDAYYTLSYSPTSASDAAAKYRKIRVVCKRPGVLIATRNGYYPSPAEKQGSLEAISYDMSTAADSMIALNGLAVTVERDNADEKGNTYTLHVRSRDLSWSTNEDGSSSAHVAVLAAVFTGKNKMVDHTLQAMTAAAKSGVNVRAEGKIANFDIVVKDSSKAARVRFVVRDSVTGMMGSVDLPLVASR